MKSCREKGQSLVQKKSTPMDGPGAILHPAEGIINGVLLGAAMWVVALAVLL